MGGRVLDHEAKNILNEGRAEGELEMAKKMATNLYKAGVTLPIIAEAADVSIEIIQKWLVAQTM